VGPRDTGHQRNGQRNNVLFTVPEGIARARQRTFEKTDILNKVAFLASRQLEAIMSITISIGSQRGSLGKASPDFRVAPNMLAA
jgi:hypothetical protein